MQFYRLDELNIEKIDKGKNNVAKRLHKQGQALERFFGKIINEKEQNLGIAFTAVKPIFGYG